MEALRTTATAKNGMLTISVPEKFEGHNLEVIVLSHDEGEVENNEIKNQKISRLLSVIGTAKDLNKNFDKHEVYDQ